MDPVMTGRSDVGPRAGNVCVWSRYRSYETSVILGRQELSKASLALQNYEGLFVG